MRIIAVESSVVSLPFDMGGPYMRFAGKVWDRLEMLLVRVQTDDGLTGWGEAFGHAGIAATRVALDTIVAPLVVGREVGQSTSEIDTLAHDVLHATHLLGRNGSFVYAWSGIEIALWDLLGKRAGLPVYRLLGLSGGHAPGSLAAYASLLHYADLDTLAHNVRAASDAGFRHIKLHQTTREAVLAAQHAVDGRDVRLMLDVNCAWDLPQAQAMAQSLRDDNLLWLEEPVWPPEDVESLARVRACGIPVAAGENAQGIHAFQAMIQARAIDIAQPSVTKIGGISAVMNIARLAARHGVSVIPHSPYFGPGFLATLHIAAALTAVSSRPPIVEVLWMQMAANPFALWVTAQGGALHVPSGPGLGCDPDADVLAQYQSGDVHRVTKGVGV